MNTPSKNFVAIAAVVALHAGVITLMLAQHGCKSAAQKPAAPAAAAPAPAPVPAPMAAASGDAGFYAPTAPAPEPAPAPMPVAQFSEPLGSISSTPAPAPAPAPVTATWKVARGDTLSKIATRNGTTVKSLKELNSLNSDNIREGEVLKLPASASATAASTRAATPAAAAPAADSTGATYQVKSGDTLGRIAARVGVKTAELMSLNGFTDSTAKNLKPGQTLKLPTNAHVPDESATPPAAVTPMTVTPMNMSSPTATPVTVTPMPIPSTGTAPPVTPVNP